MAKDNNPNSNFKVSPWLVYTAIILIFLGISFATGGSSFQEPGQLKSSDIDNMLAKGQIKNVVIFNNKDGKQECWVFSYGNCGCNWNYRFDI